MRRNNIKDAVAGMFYSKPRYNTVLPNPGQNASPWYFTAGPVFMPGADGAILHSKLSKPWQTIFGYSYRVDNPNAYNVLAGQLSYAPKGVPTVGINMQTGWTPVTQPSTNSDGTFADQGIFGYDQNIDHGSSNDITEYE